MFYAYLIKAFLRDPSLFKDVKAIVDCPLKCDPADIIQACRDGVPPNELKEMLGIPGSDLDHLELRLVHKFGRNDFLKCFSAAPIRSSTRRHTIGGQTARPSTLIDQPNDANQPPVREHARRNSVYQAKLVDMAKLLNMQSETAEAIQQVGEDELEKLRKEESLLNKETGVEEHNIPGSGGIIRLAHNVNNTDLEISPKESDISALSDYYSRLQRLGMRLVELWTHFYRRTSIKCDSERSSLVHLPRPFVVPGGRFIEIYYWDSYWIIRGLISSGFIKEAKDIIENFLYMVERLGFIPNGSRKYYQDRSQPPYLSTMLRAYYNATHDKEFIMNAYPLLEKEYAFWMNERLGHAVKLAVPEHFQSGRGKTHVVLNRFYSLEVTPRPESYRIDEVTGRLYQEYHGAADSLREHFRAIRAGAESGWDFSSRWLRPAIEGFGDAKIRPDEEIEHELHKLCLIDIDTCNVIPCDLNAMLFAVEQDLAFFAAVLGLDELDKQYQAAADRRQKAMLMFNWDPANNRWMDYDMRKQKLSKVLSAASFVPLWAGVNPEPMDDARRINLAKSLSALVKPYGIAATHIRAGLQWDMPNVWACNQHMAVDFLCGGRFWETEKSAADDDGPAMQLGINWASCFVSTVLDRFELRGTCAEKYHCTRCGKSGMDGEYVTQEGFGWTNGAVLDFMEKFGTKLSPQGLYTVPRTADLSNRHRQSSI